MPEESAKFYVCAQVGFKNGNHVTAATTVTARNGKMTEEGIADVAKIVKNDVVKKYPDEDYSDNDALITFFAKLDNPK